MKKFLLLIVCFLLIIPMSSVYGDAELNPPKEYIVQVTDSSMKSIEKAKGKIKKKHNDIILAELSNAAFSRLKSDHNVKKIEPNYKVTALGQIVPYGIEQIHATEVHTSGVYGDGINVAVMDTGIGPNDDLSVHGGTSFVYGVESYLDDNGHGTHVAGTIAASSNQIGVLGVSPNVNLYDLKVLDAYGNGSYFGVIQAIDWAIENDINIINMSFGGTGYSEILEDQIKKAYQKGILVIASAGNDGEGEDTIHYPAKFNTVIGVGAVDQNNVKTALSSVGPDLELMAPGYEVLSTLPNNEFGGKSGTSMAAPHVTGAASLVWGNSSKLSNKDIRDILNASATSMENTLHYGNGVVDAQNAINMSNDKNSWK